MLDLTAQTSTALGTLAKFTTAKDGKAAGSLIFDLDLVFTLENEQDADVADRILRGARSYFDAYKDTEARGGLNVTPIDSSGSLKLIHADDAVTVMDATVEIRRVDVKKAAKVVTATVKARVRGLKASAASHFAEYLDRRLTCEWEDGGLQQSLAFAAPTGTNAVQVVTADDGKGGYVFGIQTGQDGSKVLLDDFGSTCEVDVDSVVSKVILSPEKGADGPPLIEVIEPYADRMRKGGATPSWKYVILGIAAVRGTELEGVSRVMAPELDKAVEVALEAVAA